jgi:hypothetical protein
MRDGEGKVLTAGNMFYNMLLARQALRRHRRWSCHHSSPPARVPTSRRNYFDDVNIPDVVSGMDVLPLPVADLHYIDMCRCCQAGNSTTMLNALRGMYLLTIILRGIWSNQIDIFYEVEKIASRLSHCSDHQVRLFFINFFLRVVESHVHARHIPATYWNMLGIFCFNLTNMMGLYKLGMKPTHASLQDTNKVLQTVLTCQIERSTQSNRHDLSTTFSRLCMNISRPGALDTTSQHAQPIALRRSDIRVTEVVSGLQATDWQIKR